MPTGDAHLFDDEPEEALATFEVEVVDASRDSCGEVGYTAAELVVDSELLLPGDELVAFVVEAGLSSGDVFASPAELVEVHQPGLVEVGEAAAFGVDLVGTATDTLELGGAQLVVGDLGLASQRRFTGDQQLGP